MEPQSFPFLVFPSPGLRYHGERLPPEQRGTTDAYQDALVRAYRDNKSGAASSFPFIYDNVYDLMRSIDYLISRYGNGCSLYIWWREVFNGGGHSFQV